MRKLGSVENIEDFILAIAGGADVNGTWKGGPLVEYYFTEAMRHIVVYPAGHPKSRPDVLFGGRLGSYRYYNMDQVLRAALDDARKELAQG